MAGKKGIKRYPESIKNEIRQKQEKGQSVKSLSREDFDKVKKSGPKAIL